MRDSRGRGGWITSVTMVLLASLLLARTAGAVSLQNNSSLTISGLTFQVENCVYKINGTTQFSCSSASATLTGTDFRGPNLTVTGTSAMFTGVTNTTVYDLSYTLNVTGAAADTVNYFRSTLVGSDPAAGLTDLISTDKLFNTGGTQVSATEGINLSSAIAATATDQGFTSLVPAWSETTDLKLTGNGSSMIKLSSFNQYYGPAPEPLSVSVFLVGLAGLGAARRGRRKSSQTA